jgi:hypothetical protein
MAPPRKKRKRKPASQRAAMRGGPPAEPVAAEREVPGKVSLRGGELIIAGGDWPRKDVLLLSAATAAVLTVLVSALWFLGGTNVAFTPTNFLTILALTPGTAGLAIVFLGLSVWVAMPVVSRLRHLRRLKFFEVIAFSAVLALLCAVTTAAILQVAGPPPTLEAVSPSTPPPATPLPAVTAPASSRATASATPSARLATPAATAKATATAAPSASAAPAASGSTPSGSSQRSSLSTVLVGLADIVDFVAVAWLYPPVARILRSGPRERKERAAARVAKGPPKR